MACYGYNNIFLFPISEIFKLRLLLCIKEILLFCSKYCKVYRLSKLTHPVHFSLF